jgi:uncharacterized protein YjdB
MQNPWRKCMTLAGILVIGACGHGTTTAPLAAILTSVTIEPSIGSAVGRTILVGNMAQLTANPKDQNGNAIGATVTWSSSAPAFATVDPNSGVVTGIAVGGSTIVASAAAGGAIVKASTPFLVFPSGIGSR